MATVTISPAQYAQYMIGLGEKFMPTMIKGIRSGGMNCIPIMQRKTMTAPPASDNGTIGAVNYGTYKAAWKVRALSNGITIYNDIGYSGVIEFGRRPSPVGKAGIANLEKWAKRKMGLSDSESKSAAFAIARHLQKHPLHPRAVMTGGIDEMTEAIAKNIEHELNKVLSET